MKKLIITMLILSIFVIPVYADNAISVVVNGATVAFDAQPIIIDGRVLVPLRAIAEALNITVMWNENARCAHYCNSNNIGYYLYIDDNAVDIYKGAELPWESIIIDVPPTIYEGRTFVPLRFIAESLNVNVEWDAATQTAYIGNRVKYDWSKPYPHPTVSLDGTFDLTGWIGYSTRDISALAEYILSGDVIYYMDQYWASPRLADMLRNENVVDSIDIGSGDRAIFPILTPEMSMVID